MNYAQLSFVAELKAALYILHLLWRVSIKHVNELKDIWGTENGFRKIGKLSNH